MRIWAGHSPAGKTETDYQDPSLRNFCSFTVCVIRYSIRRRRDGSRASMERDSAEASLLAEVIAAEVEAARRESCAGRGGEDVERELGRVANVLDMLHAKGSRYTNINFYSADCSSIDIFQ